MSNLQPMMHYDELELLRKYVKYSDIICEYGSGGSTLWLASHAQKIYSIEHNIEWHKKVTNKLIDTNISNATVYHVSHDSKWISSTDGDYSTFKDYIEFPKSLGINFTFFLVDGRARIDCCKFISENFPHALVAFHDYENRAYDEEHNYCRALCYLQIVETVKTMAIMKLK